MTRLKLVINVTYCNSVAEYKKKRILNLIFFVINHEKISKSWRSLENKIYKVLKKTRVIFCSK